MILLDTPVLVWAVGESKRLSRAAYQAIRRARREGGVAIASITLWELALLVARGRIQSYGTIEDSVRLLTEGVIIRPLLPEIAAFAAQFGPDYPSDQADRLIGATARIEGLPLVTHDERIRRSPLLKTIW